MLEGGQEVEVMDCGSKPLNLVVEELEVEVVILVEELIYQ